MLSVYPPLLRFPPTEQLHLEALQVSKVDLKHPLTATSFAAVPRPAVRNALKRYAGGLKPKAETRPSPSPQFSQVVASDHTASTPLGQMGL